MKINDILNMTSETFNKMGMKEISKTLNYMVKVANERIDRLKKNRLVNQASKELDRMGIKKSFSVGRDTTLNERRNLFMKVKSFLELKTSTITGQQQYEKEVEKGFKKVGIDISKIKDRRKFFNIFEKYAEERKLANAEMRYTVFETIAENFNETKDAYKFDDEDDEDDSDEERILKLLRKNYDRLYRKRIEEKNVDLGDFYNF